MVSMLNGFIQSILIDTSDTEPQTLTVAYTSLKVVNKNEKLDGGTYT